MSERWLPPQASRAARRHGGGWRAPLCGHPGCLPRAAALQRHHKPCPERGLPQLPTRAPFLTTARRTPRAPRHATARRLTPPVAAAPPPSRPVGVPGWRWQPPGVRLIPPRPVYLGGQAAGAAGSRRRCEQEARGGSAAPLHGGSSPALRLWRSGAAPRAAGRPEAATSAGAAPVHAAPPSASGPGAAAPQSPGGRPAPPSREGAGGAGPAPCDRFPSRGRAARGRPEGCGGTPAAHKMEPEARPAKAGGPGREAAAPRGEPPASRGSPGSSAPLRSCGLSGVTSAGPGGFWLGNAVRCSLVFRQKRVSFPTPFRDSASLLNNAAARQQIAFTAFLRHFMSLH